MTAKSDENEAAGDHEHKQKKKGNAGTSKRRHRRSRKGGVTETRETSECRETANVDRSTGRKATRMRRAGDGISIKSIRKKATHDRVKRSSTKRSSAKQRCHCVNARDWKAEYRRVNASD